MEGRGGEGEKREESGGKRRGHIHACTHICNLYLSLTQTHTNSISLTLSFMNLLDHIISAPCSIVALWHRRT
jgi:hypothetical protein